MTLKVIQVIENKYKCVKLDNLVLIMQSFKALVQTTSEKMPTLSFLVKAGMSLAYKLLV